MFKFSLFRVLDSGGIKMCRYTCCYTLTALFVVFVLLCLIHNACHTATHNTEEDNSKNVVNRSETMTLRKEGEGHDQCYLINSVFFLSVRGENLKSEKKSHLFASLSHLVIRI